MTSSAKPEVHNASYGTRGISAVAIIAGSGTTTIARPPRHTTTVRSATIIHNRLAPPRVQLVYDECWVFIVEQNPVGIDAILSPLMKLGHDFDLYGSRDVIDDVIIRSAIGHFLLVGNWYQASISNRFRDICI